jgi:hypothetical protein
MTHIQSMKRGPRVHGPEAEPLAIRTDGTIALSVAAVYLLLALTLLPPGEYPRAVGVALLIFGLVIGAARLLGRGHVPGFSVLGIAMASAAVLAAPAFPALGGTVPAAVPIGFLGSQAATLLWVALRWQPGPPAPPMKLLHAWGFGLGAAALLSVVATIPIVLAAVTEGPSPVLLVYAGYFVGFLGAATLYWLLQRVAHLATGLYLIGMLPGTCVYGAIAPVVSMVEAEPMLPLEMLMIGVVAGAFVGPAVALGRAKD